MLLKVNQRFAHIIPAGPPIAVRSESDCEARGRWFELRSGHILSFIFGHEKISKTILTLLLIQEGQLLVTGETTGKLPRRLAQEECG